MALKKDNLPVNVDVDTEQGSSITYANEVVAIIAGVAASEVEGIAGMCNVSGNLLGKNRAVTKGVKVEIGTEEAWICMSSWSTARPSRRRRMTRRKAFARPSKR